MLIILVNMSVICDIGGSAINIVAIVSIVLFVIFML